MKPAGLPPVVFLGPTAPVEDVSSVLPDALILPPVRRGDLYRFRILKHALFVIVDGVFVQRLGVSPREIIDVMDDGATVVGLSSMGALRAADCAPAGAFGLGRIYRLYRRRAISSEDEVAVAYREDQPFPALTQPLINMRIALRRAVKRGLIAAKDAKRVVAAAEREHFSERTWRSAFGRAGILPEEPARTFLASVDAKREDLRLAVHQIAERLKVDGAFAGAPRSSTQVFGILGDGRERAPDPLDGASLEQVIPDFANWLVDSGQLHRLGVSRAEPRLSKSGDGAGLTAAQASSLWKALRSSRDLDAVLMRFLAQRRAVEEARRRRVVPERRDVGLAEIELANAHLADSWLDLMDRCERSPVRRARLKQQRDRMAMAKSLKRRLFSKHEEKDGRTEETVSWRRT